MIAAGRPYRCTVLCFAAFMIVGSYFAYDSIGAMVEPLVELLGVDRGDIGFTYTVYSLAAIPAVFAGGLLIDRLGTRRASLLFSVLVTLGAAIVAAAPSLPVLYLGRLIFGMGSEALIVAQSAILARWFTGKELALSFGIALTVSRLGTLFTFNTEALLAEWYGVRFALWVAAALCGLSLLVNLAYNWMDKKAQPVLGLKEAGGGDKISFADLSKLPATYWYVTFLCLTFYSAIFPFTALSTDFFAQ